MNKSTVNKAKDVIFDEDGFLAHPEMWNESTARLLARQHGINTLTHTHWLIIETLRDHYRKFGAPPMFHHVSHVTHLDKHCVEKLFHSHFEAWLVSGLPNPGEEAKTYM